MIGQESISQKVLDEIDHVGCCLGKFRVLLDGIYHCYLDGIYACRHQDIFHEDEEDDYYEMSICEIENQNPCEECDKCIDAAGKTQNDSFQANN